jgi:hypothetical protein
VPVKFNVITGWEFWEHIAEKDIAATLDNIARHAEPGCLFVGSISRNVEPHHCTAQPKEWWVGRFVAAGWRHAADVEAHFGHDTVRGGPDPNGISYSVAFWIGQTA